MRNSTTIKKPETTPPVSLIRLETAFKDCVSISSIPSFASFDQFLMQIRGLIDIPDSQAITVKWIDAEGHPVLLSSHIEFLEMVRLAIKLPKPRLTIHIFSGIPAKAGMYCSDETPVLYRRGIKHMPKVYHLRGHAYCSKFIKKNIPCVRCNQSLWGLFTNSLCCLKCKLFIHKKCFQAYFGRCTGAALESEDGSEDLRLSTGCDEDESRMAQNGTIGLKSFRFLSVIGAGSYAKVLAAQYLPTKRIYALKVILKSILFDHNEDLQSIFTEKEVFKIATCSPFLIGLHSTFQTSNRLVFVIDLANGGDLMAHMEQMQRLSEDHSRFYGAEIILGLQYLHSKGIIYRDLKLDNVLLDHEGHVKLTDYGLCKMNTFPGEMTSTFCGTPNYLAPELITGPCYGFQVDFWAFGVLMFEMMSGRSPFEVPSNIGDVFQEKYLFQLIINKNIRIPRFLTTSASSLLQGLLNRDPSSRLGCSLDTGQNDIETHDFFCSVNWEAVRTCSVTPPYKPKVVDRNDLSTLPETFTKRPLRLTKQPPDVAARVDQSVFEGFDFLNGDHLESE